MVYICLIIAICIRGYFSLHNPQKEMLKRDVGQAITLEGIIANVPLVKDFLQSFVLETPEGFFIKVGADKFAELGYGDWVSVTGKLSAPRNFSGSGGRVFDYINYLAKDDIFYEFKKANVVVIERANRKGISGRLFELKRGFINNLKEVLGEPHAALASGLVVGEKAALGKDLLDEFRRAGLVHIIVLSGYNITIIGTSIRRILSFLPRNTSIILGAVGIILFGMLVGGGATVIRSCIMALIALFGELMRRDYRAGRGLVIAGMLMLVENPLILLYDPSFQLSFLATLGLIMLSTPIEERIGFVSEIGGLRSLVASTFATQIFVSPLIFYMMGQLSLIGIVVNLVVLPLVPLTMLMVFLSGFIGFFWNFGSQIAGWVSHILLSYELVMVKFFAAFPLASIEVPAFSGWIVAGFYTFYLALFLKLPSMVSQFIFAKKSST